MRRVLILIALLPGFCFGQLSGKVVSIADGDTFTLLTKENIQVKVRLHGIDCPEKNQDFGQVARQFLSDLIYNQTVNVHKTDTDRYGRTIAIVMIDTVNLNEALLQAGLAWHYKHYDKSEAWAKIETTARQQRKGLWSKSDAVPPWEFRKKPK